MQDAQGDDPLKVITYELPQSVMTKVGALSQNVTFLTFSCKISKTTLKILKAGKSKLRRRQKSSSKFKKNLEISSPQAKLVREERMSLGLW